MSSKLMKDRRHVVYTHCDKDGVALYIGCTVNPFRRQADYLQCVWFHRIAYIKFDHFPSRGRALKAEAEAIRAHRPEFNCAHNRGREK